MNKKIENKSKDIQLEEVEKIIQNLIGDKVGNVRIDDDESLLIEFGELTTEVQKITRLGEEENMTQKGEWGLCLYDCFWRIVHNGNLLTSFLDESEEIVDSVTQINGYALESVVISQPFFDVIFKFSDGYTIDSFSVSKDDMHWTLRTPNGKYLCFGPESKLSYRD